MGLHEENVRVSNETLVGQLPFVDDVQKELDRIKDEQDENMELYGGAFDMSQKQGMNGKKHEE